MSIAIATIWNDDFKEIAAITIPVMQEYCIRHGYTFHSRFSKFVSPDIIWERLALAKITSHGRRSVVYMDADVLITNMTKKVEDIPGFNHLHIASSENGVINDGVFIWNTSAWIESLAEQEWLPSNQEIHCPQDAINKKLGNAMDIYHVEPRVMNSVLNAEYGRVNPLTEWQHGDFVLHLPGIGNKRRVELLKEYSQKIIR